MNLEFLQWARVSATDWYQVKLFFQHGSGFSMDALRGMGGAVLQLVIALVFRSSVAAVPCLRCSARMINEAQRLTVEMAAARMQFGDCQGRHPDDVRPRWCSWSSVSPQS